MSISLTRYLVEQQRAKGHIPPSLRLLLEVVARGARLTVSFNGMQTVDVVDGKRRSGRISLQSAGGTVRFRKVMVRPL